MGCEGYKYDGYVGSCNHNEMNNIEMADNLSSWWGLWLVSVLWSWLSFSDPAFLARTVIRSCHGISLCPATGCQVLTADTRSFIHSKLCICILSNCYSEWKLTSVSSRI